MIDKVGALGSPRYPQVDVAEAAPSGVLVLVYEHLGDPHLVLTRRAQHLRQHAHEVSFPGGRQEHGDRDLWATALREAEEEIALDAREVSAVGCLDGFTTVGSRSLLCPFVGSIQTRPELVAAPEEVETVIHVPVHELLQELTWREEFWIFSPGMPERTMSFFELASDTVWGATAAILRQFLCVVTDTRNY